MNDGSLQGQSPCLTPDGRYLVIVGKAGPRLWRASNPNLPEHERSRLVSKLMAARRSLRRAQDEAEMLDARRMVDEAKKALGERGGVWWSDGAPDFNRRLIKHTPYHDWWDNRIA
jgi:hypothetical protein